MALSDLGKTFKGRKGRLEVVGLVAGEDGTDQTQAVAAAQAAAEAVSGPGAADEPLVIVQKPPRKPRAPRNVGNAPEKQSPDTAAPKPATVESSVPNVRRRG